MEHANIDEQLLSEFKNAANSVTRLFKLAREAKSTDENLRKQGYISALQDLLLLLEANPNLDVQGWAMHMLLDMNGPSSADSPHSANEDEQLLTLQSPDDAMNDEDDAYLPGDKRRSIYRQDTTDKRMKP